MKKYLIASAAVLLTAVLVIAVAVCMHSRRTNDPAAEAETSGRVTTTVSGTTAAQDAEQAASSTTTAKKSKHKTNSDDPESEEGESPEEDDPAEEPAPGDEDPEEYVLRHKNGEDIRVSPTSDRDPKKAERELPAEQPGQNVRQEVSYNDSKPRDDAPPTEQIGSGAYVTPDAGEPAEDDPEEFVTPAIPIVEEDAEAEEP